jgi:coenzyme F420-reducing hydrogenase alpha subunit
LRIIEGYTMPDAPCIELGHTGDALNSTLHASVLRPSHSALRRGYGCTEAPRGLLYHRYDLDAEGLIQDAKIVPPTSQNQKAMEEDLRAFVSERISMPKDELTWQCEQAIRNYDPCISCATHFLRLNIDRE